MRKRSPELHNIRVCNLVTSIFPTLLPSLYKTFTSLGIYITISNSHLLVKASNAT